VSSLIFSIVFSVLFIAFHAWLVACETLLIKLRYAQLSSDDDEDSVVLGRLFRASHELAPTLRFGRVATTLGAGALLFPLLWGAWGGHIHGWGLRLFLGLLTFALIFCCYWFVAVAVPRRLAVDASSRLLVYSVWPLLILCALVRPVLRGGVWLGFKVLGPKSGGGHEGYDQIDVDIQMAALTPELQRVSPWARSVFQNALCMNELDVSDVLLPRSQVEYLDINEPIEENIRVAMETGHTRFPLCDGDLDNTLGIIHIKDLFRTAKKLSTLDLRHFRRKTLRIPSTESLESALQKLLSNRVHMAIVIDEFGGTVGVLTFEAILEELVGDIHDEFDTEEAWIERLKDGSYKVSGLLPLHDLEETLGIEIDNDEVSTIGGLITQELGRIPVRGEVLELFGFLVRVDEVDPKRIISATLEKQKFGIEHNQ
jgi:CBS domain containing-hemolysin-like protein